MPPRRTVLEHLLDGREALVLEVKRLTTAIEELDAVIGRVGGSNLRESATDAATRRASQPRANPAEAAARPSPLTRSRRSLGRKPSSRIAKHSKSIRVHVLEMLGSEDREFGLAEVIDRIHAAGISAHDDAVRSITVKLMKDGRVERVGRGQYRLATAAPDSTEPTDTQPETAPVDSLAPPNRAGFMVGADP